MRADVTTIQQLSDALAAALLDLEAAVAKASAPTPPRFAASDETRFSLDPSAEFDADLPGASDDASDDSFSDQLLPAAPGARRGGASVGRFGERAAPAEGSPEGSLESRAAMGRGESPTWSLAGEGGGPATERQEALLAAVAAGLRAACDL